jgi:hypothetical protein
VPVVDQKTWRGWDLHFFEKTFESVTVSVKQGIYNAGNSSVPFK